MLEQCLTVGYAIFLWWLGTGVVFFIASLPRSTMRPSLALATLGLLIAFHAVERTATADTVLAAMIAFTAAIAIWGWCELTFLFGLITGPNRAACPVALRGHRRFVQATRAVIHHELLLVAAGLAIAFFGAAAVPPVALYTFGVLWLLRLSAKFNLFLGTPNFSEDLAPRELRYLGSYFRHARFNLLFPVAVLGGGWLAWHLSAMASQATVRGAQAGYLMLATLTALGVFEHLMMMIPLRDSALWTWIAGRDRQAEIKTGWNDSRSQTGET